MAKRKVPSPSEAHANEDSSSDSVGEQLVLAKPEGDS